MTLQILLRSLSSMNDEDISPGEIELNGSDAYLAQLIKFEDIDQLICNLGIKSPFFSLSNSLTGISPFEFWRFHVPVTAVCDSRAVIKQLLESGSTLIIRHVQILLPKVWALTRYLEARFPKVSIQANCYLTPPHNCGLARHADPRHTLLIQQYGRKEWEVWGNSNSDNEPMRILLTQGYALMIPRGMEHSSVSQEEFSMHLTLGLLNRDRLGYISVTPENNAMLQAPPLLRVI